MWASANPPPHPWGDWSRYADEPLADDVVAKVVDLLADCPVRTAESNGSLWWLGWIGGEVVDRLARTDTAYVHRGTSMLLRATPVWLDSDPASVGDELLAWTGDVIGVFAAPTPDESYPNFANRLLPNPLEQYFAENLQRLIDVKTRYDPGNLFRNEQSVAPRSPSRRHCITVHPSRRRPSSTRTRHGAGLTFLGTRSERESASDPRAGALRTSLGSSCRARP